MSRVAYLGPEGTFTHQAAVQWVRSQGQPAAAPAASGTSGRAVRPVEAPVELVPATTVTDVYAGVASGAFDQGIVAIENSVEGYVVPSLDAIVGSEDVVAIDEVVLEITFDAFVRPGHGDLTEVTAHPHGLAQCQGFVTRSGALPVPAASNASACRDATVHQVALGPSICGELYGLELLEADAGRTVRFQPAWATRAELLARLGRADDARVAYDHAIALTHQTPERRYLQDRRAALPAGPTPGDR